MWLGKFVYFIFQMEDFLKKSTFFKTLLRKTFGKRMVYSQKKQITPTQLLKDKFNIKNGETKLFPFFLIYCKYYFVWVFHSLLLSYFTLFLPSILK